MGNKCQCLLFLISGLVLAWVLICDFNGYISSCYRRLESRLSYIHAGVEINYSNTHFGELNLSTSYIISLVYYSCSVFFKTSIE